MTVAQALDTLQLSPAQASDTTAAKAAYRRLSVKWHPDKNPGLEEKATALFTRVAGAYHTLTTSNFDYARWAATYVVPPMQGLEEVLAFALGGADPGAVEALLRKRGDFRPHAAFGVDLAVPWSAGKAELPSWEVVGAAHSSTRALGDGGASDALSALALVEEVGPQGAWSAPERALGASSDRPWERVGATGFGVR